MRTALLRAAAVVTIAATPLAAQRAAIPHLDGQPLPARSVEQSSRGLLPNRTAPRVDGAHANAPALSPAVDPARRGLFGLGPGDSVGYTYYDLQTNGAMPDRIVNWPDNAKPQGVVTSTLLWTASVDAPTPPGSNYDASTRGSYGAVHDGTGWSPMRGQWARLEEIRTGFVELERLSDGRIVFANHSATGVHVWIELEVGSNEFFKQDIPGSEGGLWASIAVTEDDDIHVIWTYTTDHANEDEVYYSRSTDDGNTFSDAVPLSGPNSVVTQNMRTGFGANSYAIAARGSNVAVWFLSSSIEILQLRSFDEGATWPAENAVFVFDPTNRRAYHDTEDPEQRLWPDPTFDADTAIGFRTDTVPGPGSALDLMLDADGYVHGVASVYPTYVTRYYPPGGDTTATTFRRGTIYQATYNYPDAGLVYLRERDNQLSRSFVPQPGGLDNTADPDGYPNYFIRRAYHGGYSLYPQLGMDDDANVYLVFSSGVEGDVQQARRRPDSAMKSWLNHHVFVTWMRGDDAERRWMAPQSLTPNGFDAKYAALADLVDDELHIAYQIDRVVGEMIPDTLAPIARERNNIEATFLQRSSLADPTGIAEPIAINEVGLVVSPNPIVGDASISFTVGRTGPASVTLVDALGRVAAVVAEGDMPAGTHTRTLVTSELAAGSYHLVARSAGSVATAAVRVVR